MSNTTPVIHSIQDSNELKAAWATFDKALQGATIRAGFDRTPGVYAKPGSDEANNFVRAFGVLLDSESSVDSDIMPLNMGGVWLHESEENVTALLQMIGGDPIDFLRQHMHRHISVILFESRLVEAVGKEFRCAFIRDVLRVSRPISRGWIRSLLEAGLSHTQVSALILNQLKYTDVGSNYGDTFVGDFVKGADCAFMRRTNLYPRLRKPQIPTLWSVMTDMELYDALAICDRKVPGILFKNVKLLYGLQARFIGDARFETLVKGGKDLIRGLLTEYANKLTSLEGVLPEIFSLLPPSKQVKLIRKFDGGNTTLLVHAAMAAVDIELFNDFSAVTALRDRERFEHVVPAIQPVLMINGCLLPVDAESHPDERISLAGYINKVTENNAAWAGWAFGVVRVQDGGSRVVYDSLDRTIVHDSDDSSQSYHPAPGHYVMYRMPAEEQLCSGGPILATFIKVYGK